MNDRERIIELMHNVPDGIMEYSDGSYAFFLGSMADHLIANGVTVQKQGKWEEKEHGEFYTCSCCGFITDYRLSNYCPNCGAKMDGGSKNDC